MRGKYIPFSEEDRKTIVEQYEGGTGASVIAKDHHCATARVNEVLRDAGIRTKNDPFTDDHKSDIRLRYEGGEDISSIARSYRCRYYKMRDLIESLNVEKRVITTTNTPIERRLHDALKRRGIGFTTQVRLVDRYVVDIKINQGAIVIEADGERYHRSSKRDAERDRKHTDAGYLVFHFSGSEINKDAEACIQHVVDTCGLVTDENPVYDIRTTFSGSDHPRWNRHTLQCLNCGSNFEVLGKHRNRKFCRLSCYHEHVRKTGVFKGGRSPIERPD